MFAQAYHETFLVGAGMTIRPLEIMNRAKEALSAPRLPEFLSQLMPDQDERREQPRVPFCRRVTLYFGDSPLPTAAVLRDISADGMGLLHEVPVELEEATVRIRSDSGKTLCARVKILWCKEAGCGCYSSGGTFVRVFEEDPIQLDGEE